MKNVTFAQGVGFALLSSIIATVILLTMSSVFPASSLIRLIIGGIVFFYILYLFSRNDEKTGRLSILLVWLLVTILSLAFVNSLMLFISFQLIMIWLIRSLYFYNSTFSSLTDLCLTGVSLVIVIWVWTISFSIFLSIWCFFLIQALFVFIPEKINKQKIELFSKQKNDNDFEQAYKSAEMAVRKLTTKY